MTGTGQRLAAIGSVRTGIPRARVVVASGGTDIVVLEGDRYRVNPALATKLRRGETV